MLEFELDSQPDSSAVADAIDQESPARPCPLFGLTNQPEVSPAEAAYVDPANIPIPSLERASVQTFGPLPVRGGSVTRLDPAVLEALAGLDGALVADSNGRLLAFGAILRHDLHSFADCDLASPPALAEGARTTAALVASHFGPVLKISEDGIVSCFLDGARVWDL